ncbi:MAG: hypothetical protein H6835_14025 [Planctomycetes bacterium]|nr:hypothetical protein [Planctomycetota bacterium]
MTSTIRARLRSALLQAAMLATTAGIGVAQCGDWLLDDGVPGIQAATSNVRCATAWDPDGGGPLAARLVFAGPFAQAGTALTPYLAVFDPTTQLWTSLGSGFNADVFAVAAGPNGALYAGGDFFVAGGGFATSVARWDGTDWQPLAAGLDNRVSALVVMPDGSLIAGGTFASSGGAPLSHIARWNGVSWSALGAGVNGTVVALAVADNGDVIAGGSFTMAGGAPAAGVARWNGSSWSPLGGGIAGAVLAVATAPNGDVYCGGDFAQAGGVNASCVARWDGTAWHALGGGITGSLLHEVLAMDVQPGGDVVVGGRFDQAGGAPANRVARWDGAAWHPLGGGVTSSTFYWGGGVSALTHLPDGSLWLGGPFDRADGIVAHGVARWDGTQMARSNDGIDGSVTASLPLRDGGLLLGGSFRTIGGVDTPCVARFDGGGWQALGDGVGGLVQYDNVNALVELANGELLLSGTIYVQTSPTSTGPGAPVWHFDGTAWSSLPGIAGTVRDLAQLPDGRVVAVGTLTVDTPSGPLAAQVATWDGSAWQSIDPGFDGTIHRLVVRATGELVVGGTFTNFGGTSALRVASWDGGSWSPLGGGLPSTPLLALRSNGQLVAMTSSNPTWYSFAGGTWTNHGAMGWSYAIDLAALPDGDVVAAGQSSAPPYAMRLLRWNGSTWSDTMPTGTSVVSVHHTGLIPQGGLLLGGAIRLPGMRASSALSQYMSTCPAGAVSAGAGCAGASGQPVYAATELPWLGGSYRARVTDLPAQGLVLQLLGTGPAIQVPLPAALLPASAACMVHVLPEVFGVQFASGSAETSLAIPDSSTLLGAQLRDQLVALELDDGGALLESTASNALLLTIGTF